jgi:hypothetical protein
VRVQPVAQVAHHPLADDVGGIGLNYAESAVQYGRSDHDSGERPQQAQIGRSTFGEQCVIEDCAYQQGVDDSKPCRHKNQQYDADDLKLVWTEGCGRPSYNILA